MKQLFATKSAADFHEIADGHQLHKALGAPALIALGIGVIIGTGIFVLTGIVAAQHTGPALVLSLLLAALGCALAGLCYAEFAAMIPVSGSAYSYTYATLGEALAWFIGWNLILEYTVAPATVAVGWSGYVVSLFEQIGVQLPATLTNAPFRFSGADHSFEMTGAIINLPAVVVVALMTVLCYVGIRQSASFNNLIVVIKTAVVILFIAVGVFYINPDNWVPFLPENTGVAGQFGWTGVATGAAIIFFAYIGFDCVSTAALEAKNPQRDMPIGILVSLGVCTLLFVAVAAVLTGMVNYTELNVAAPVALALDRHPEVSWLSGVIKVGAVIGMTSVVLVLMLGQARIFYAMSRDGLLPPLFGKVHPRFRTPYLSTVITGLGAGVAAGLFPIQFLSEMVSIGTLLAFVMVCFGVLVLRYIRPELHRPFRVPYPWLVCPGGVLVCGYMMTSLQIDTWWRLLIWTALGLVVYLIYGYRHSRLRQRANAAA